MYPVGQPRLSATALEVGVVFVWKRLGALLGASWRVLGAPWYVLGVSPPACVVLPPVVKALPACLVKALADCVVPPPVKPSPAWGFLSVAVWL